MSGDRTDADFGWLETTGLAPDDCGWCGQPLLVATASFPVVVCGDCDSISRWPDDDEDVT